MDLKVENSLGANIKQTPGIHVLRVETIYSLNSTQIMESILEVL